MQLYRLIIDGALVSDESDEYIYLIHLAYPTYAYLPTETPPSIKANVPYLNAIISPIQFSINDGEFSKFFVYFHFFSTKYTKENQIKIDLLANPNIFSITKHHMKFHNSSEFIEKNGCSKYEINPIPVNYNVSLSELLTALDTGEYLGNYISVRWEIFSSN